MQAPNIISNQVRTTMIQDDLNNQGDMFPDRIFWKNPHLNSFFVIRLTLQHHNTMNSKPGNNFLIWSVKYHFSH